MNTGVFLATIDRWVAMCGLLLFIFAEQGWAQGLPADLVLSGEVTGARHKTYFEVPFAVPAGTHRISVDFQYTGKEERATLALRVFDPESFRGESDAHNTHLPPS